MLGPNSVIGESVLHGNNEADLTAIAMGSIVEVFMVSPPAFPLLKECCSRGLSAALAQKVCMYVFMDGGMMDG